MNAPRYWMLAELTADLYLAVVLSLTTGARQAEIMGLRWPQIDFTRQVITLEATKNGDRRAFPLGGRSRLALLKERGKGPQP
jgi:integrase